MKATVQFECEWNGSADALQKRIEDHLRDSWVLRGEPSVSLDPGAEPWPTESWDDPRAQSVLVEIAEAGKTFRVGLDKQMGCAEPGCIATIVPEPGWPTKVEP